MPELSMRRWYTITITNQLQLQPSSVRLFFKEETIANYSIRNSVLDWSTFDEYPECYGYTVGAGDLVVSKMKLLI
ncbi:MAG: hypothetical protein IPP53_17420 [Bacteroidetes bacterium]|nr:hypothetical protein [Bacteroidota bacterium]